MKLKIIIFVLVFLASSNKVFAKTTLYLQKDSAVLTSEIDVLGINTDSAIVEEEATQKTTIDAIDQLLSVIPTKNKLTVSSISTQAVDLGKQEIDKLVLVENEKVTELENKDGLIVITSGDTQAETDLPLVVKQKDGKIFVSKNNNVQVLNLLPSDARKLIEGAPVRFVLKEDKAQLVYEYTKEDNNKLFGLIPLTTKVTTTVSAQTGKVHSQSSSWVFDFLKKLLA